MDELNSFKKAALYIRVSTHSQEELSPDSQKRLLLDYAEKNHFLVEEQWIFQENGISGRTADKRPQFQQMIASAKSDSHPFDAILVWKFSRFARNQEESIVYKSMLRGKYGVDVISISEPIMEGPFGSLIERIIEWMDEFYSIRLSGDVSRGMTEKALRGGYQSRPPLGITPLLQQQRVRSTGTLCRKLHCPKHFFLVCTGWSQSLLHRPKTKYYGTFYFSGKSV